MGSIPIANKVAPTLRIPDAQHGADPDDKILFSFAAIEKDKYFNLDGTCENWSSDLFNTMQQASMISIKEVYAGKYSGHSSPFRIHPHQNVKNPCSMPQNTTLEEMWQIRISRSKGGIHGVFVGNVFYVIWFDPQHNLYPDENHGGLKRIIPPSTCCKDRDEDVSRLTEENMRLTEEIKAYEELFNGLSG